MKSASAFIMRWRFYRCGAMRIVSDQRLVRRTARAIKPIDASKSAQGLSTGTDEVAPGVGGVTVGATTTVTWAVAHAGAG